MVSPAGPCAPELYLAGSSILASRYRVVHGAQHPGPADDQLPFLAASDQRRAAAVNQALNDPAVEAIFFARGGYGCSRLLDVLDQDALQRRRLPMVGFSDITALHAWATCSGVPSIHGPMLSQLPRLPEPQLEQLWALVEGQAVPPVRRLEALAGGRARGPLFGGNLTLLAHLCGTRWLPDLSGRILLLEEVGEVPYRVDRSLTQLQLAGVLPRLAGVVVGDLLGCEPDLEPQQLPGAGARAVLLDRLGSLGVPVVLGAPVGHGDRNLALPLGAQVTLDADAGTLEVG